MTRRIAGLTFRVSSPSLFEMVHDWPGVSILVRYNGFKWVIDYRDFNSDAKRFFPSRDAAIEVLASRRAA